MLKFRKSFGEHVEISQVFWGLATVRFRRERPSLMRRSFRSTVCSPSANPVTRGLSEPRHNATVRDVFRDVIREVWNAARVVSPPRRDSRSVER